MRKATGVDAPRHDIQIEEGGKPYCADGPAISIAHTEDTVVCAITNPGEIGIDIERVDDERDVSQIAERFLSAEEREWIDPDPASRFFMLWVLKEAFVKAHGRSIFGGLEKLRCTVEPPAINASASEGGFSDLSLYALGNLYLALATTETGHGEVEFVTWPAAAADLVPGTTCTQIASTCAG